MFDSILSKIASALLAPILAISAWFNPTPEPPPAVGTALPEAVAVFETSLAAPITANATTMTLTSNSIRGGGSLSGFNCFTIDEGSAQAEYVCGTVATTTVTGLTRGISPADGITEDTDLQFSHRRGANVKITDFPIIQRLKLQNNGEGTFENALSYATGVTPTGNNHLTDVEYVLSVVNGGTVSFDRQIVTGNAGETFATGTVVYLSASDREWYKTDADDSTTYSDTIIGIAQGNGTNGSAVSGGILLSGKDTSQSGLTAGARYFLSSTAGGLSTATSSQVIGIALSTSEILLDPSILDTYNGYSTTYAGINTFTGTTTLATTTISGPATFSGSITGHASTTYGVYTASSTWTKPAGLEYIEVWVCGGGNSGGDEGAGGGGAGACAYEVLDKDELAATTSVAVIVGGVGATSQFGDFLSATGGSANSSGTGGAGGTATGGDLNIDGQRGGDGGQGTDDDGGAGGSCMFGFGGPSLGTGISGSSGGANGSPGVGYCSGGSAARPGSDGTFSGGAGKPGIVTIRTYF